MKLHTKILSITLILAQIAPTSKIYAGKSGTQGTCNSLINTAGYSIQRPRKRFTPEQDRILSELAKQSDQPNWNYIATQVGGNKTAKQCRERYQHYLSPNISQKPWSPIEDFILVQAHICFGNDWAKIATRLPGRTNMQVKNRYNGHLRTNDQQFNAFIRYYTYKNLSVKC